MATTARGIAVLCALLVVTATTVPAVVATPDRTTASPPQVVDRTILEPNATTPVEQKGRAINLVGGLPDDPNVDRDRIRSLLEGTLSAYRDGSHVERERVFHDDAQAVRLLSTVAAENPRIVNDSSSLVVAADRQTATQSVAEANRAYDRFGDEVDSPGQRRRAERAIDNAERALTRAEQALEDARGRNRLSQRVGDRARALKFYAQAWRHSQRALDILDAATAPEVRFDSRADPLRLDDRTVTRNLSGTVTDVRPYELENVTLTVEGREVVVPLNSSTAAVGNATFTATVTLEQRASTVTVSVTDPVGTDDAAGETRRGRNGKGKQSGGQRETGQTATATLLLDGDGLTDRYERTVTGTDPLDPDSDANATQQSEADDGVLDGREDFDGDGLRTAREAGEGTDPLAADTDGDGLDDGFEVRNDPPVAPVDRFDPLDPDTDDDGVDDAAEDTDGDGLTTAEELALGTDYDAVDTDGDGIDDPNESVVGTNATVADTDGDGLADGVEANRLPTDPLDPDTDDDGVLDGNETFTTTVRNASTGVSVALRGEGDVAEDVTITPKENYFGGRNFSAGPTVRLTNRTAFETATVRIPIAEEVPEENYDDLSIYRWDGTANDTWSPIETTIENGTAIAETDGFSFFTVIDSEEWVSATTVPTSGGGENATPISFPAQTNFTCSDACTVTNETTLLLGGEPSARKITVEQGNTSVQVVPLSNGQRIEEFYDYGNAEINSPLPIAKSDTSRLFFWSGPNGLSLVVLHDKPRDGSGAAVDLAFDGLPVGQGSWVVEDDPGDFDRGSATRPEWTWNYDNTDGGVFRGGLTNRSITITPYFNDRASSNPLTPGTISSWEVLTGQATAPESSELSLTDPVTVTIPAAPAENESADTGGTSGSASFEYELRDGTQEIAIRYQTEQTTVDPSVTVTLTGPEGTTITEELNVGTVGTVEEILDVSNLSTGTVSVTYAADGVDLRTQFVPRGSQVDSDNDGIPDRLEDREWTARNGPAKTFRTSSDNPDTDGDGIPDGVEANFATEVIDGERRTVVTLASNPNETDTDGDGLTDGEEKRLGTNPLLVDTEADGIPDAEDPKPTVPNGLEDDSEEPFHLSNGEPTEEFLDGMVYGDWGYVNDRSGSRTAAYLFGWIFPYILIAAGYVPVVEDAVEIALEVRDCLAINDALWENALDCGFALWELATTGAKIIGAVTSITGVGAALAGSAIAADEAADLGRAVSVTVQAIKRAPPSVVEPVGRMIGKQFAGVGVDLVRRALERLPTRLGDSLATGLRRGQLENAGLSEDVAERVAKNVEDLGAARRVVEQIDDLDQVPVALRSAVITNVAQRSDAALLTDAYTAPTLQNVIRATGDTDELLDTAASAARAGKADQVARLADELDPNTFGRILEIDRVTPAFKLVDQADRAPEVLSNLRALGDDALRRFLSLEDSLAQANDIDQIGKTPEQLATETRLAMTRASTSTVDGVAMSTQTIDRLSRAIDAMAAGDVDNFANHLNDRIAKNADNLDPDTPSDVLSSFSTVKGASFEMIIAREVFGVDNVKAIGTKVDNPNGPGNFEADLVLTDGAVVEAKTKGSGLGTSKQIADDVENIREFQKRSTEYGDPSKPVYFVVNKPRNIYKQGEIGSELRDKVKTVRDGVTYEVRFRSAAELSDSVGDTSPFILEFV